MTDFLNNILSFPTLLFTGLLILVLLYWLSSLLGFGDVDLEVDAGDVDLSDAAGASGFLTKFKLDGIPITVSLSTVVFFCWILSFLMVHFYQDEPMEDWLKIFVGFWVIVLVPVISALLAGIVLTPLKPIFHKMKNEAEGQKAASFIGQAAIVRTNKVTMNFGDADMDSGGASLILKIRAEEPNNFKRGDRVMLSQYHPQENTYTIKSFP